MSCKVSIAPEVAAELRNHAEFAGRTVRLTREMAPAEYAAVNDILTLMGAKWNTSKRVHEFAAHVSRDAEAVIADALAAGFVINRKKERQAFYTPAALIRELLAKADFLRREDMRILEPSCGDGRMADAAQAMFPAAKVDVCELDDHARAAVAERFEVIGSDFLKVTPRPDYDLIVMNPPFAKGQAEAHILHAMRFLRPGGYIFAIAPAAIGKGKTKRDADFLAKTRFRHFFDAVAVPRGAFVESGTCVETVMLFLSGREECPCREAIEYASSMTFTELSNNSLKDIRAMESHAKTRADILAAGGRRADELLATECLPTCSEPCIVALREMFDRQARAERPEMADLLDFAVFLDAVQTHFSDDHPSPRVGSAPVRHVAADGNLEFALVA